MPADGDGGGQLVAAAVGAMVGAIVGSEAGKSLDRADRPAMPQAQRETLEIGRSGGKMTWTRRDSANSGGFVVGTAYRDGSGRLCRRFRYTVTAAGEKRVAFGTACRQPDGAWKPA